MENDGEVYSPPDEEEEQRLTAAEARELAYQQENEKQAERVKRDDPQADVDVRDAHADHEADGIQDAEEARRTPVEEDDEEYEPDEEEQQLDMEQESPEIVQNQKFVERMATENLRSNFELMEKKTMAE